MNQEAINNADWSNPGNWSGPRWLSLYSSWQDNRVWVPKQIPALGRTINLGHQRGSSWFLGVILAAFAFVVATNIFVINLIAR